MSTLEKLLEQRGGGTINIRLDSGRWQAQIVLSSTDTRSSATLSGSGKTFDGAIAMALNQVTPSGTMLNGDPIL